MKPFLSLWRCWLPLVLMPVHLVVIGGGAFFLPGLGLLTCIVFGLVLFQLSRQWILRFVAHTWCFRTERHGEVVFHYAPSLEGHCDLPALAKQVWAANEDLGEDFGLVLPKIVVFLLDRPEPIQRVLRRPAFGFAIVQCSAIVISNADNVKEAVRHELAHLFAARWSGTAPPLFGEGLAVWLQGTWYRWHIDDAARQVLRHWRPRLSSLRNRRLFFSGRHCHECYVLAGSFTGFLIRRYGWDAYRRFYRKSDALNFNRYFRKVFGVSFDKAEWQWRTELDVMAALGSRVRRNAFQE
jgi:hypothetical protein